MLPGDVFDLLLGGGLLWIAWRAVTSRDLFNSIVLFIAFGLLMALAWVRLDAPDVALAEAAIGAGLTGALLLGAFARLGSSAGKPERAGTGRALCAPKRFMALAAAAATAVGLGWAIWSLPPRAAGLSGEVAASLGVSGVTNPVTAVLLNFRGYDTLLETAVLLLALLGVWSLGGAPLRREPPSGPVLEALTGTLIPLLILIAAYLLWVGAHAPGGAFQAGSVLGAAGVLLLLAGWRPPARVTGFPLRLLLAVGPAVFVAMAALLHLVEGELLRFPPAWAGILILILETVAALSIGVTLAALFLGGDPHRRGGPGG